MASNKIDEAVDGERKREKCWAKLNRKSNLNREKPHLNRKLISFKNRRENWIFKYEKLNFK